jgi:hypothetical protein
MTDNNGYVLAPLPVAPVNETDMVLLPKGLNALKQVAKEVLQQDVGYVPVVWGIFFGMFKPWVQGVPRNSREKVMVDTGIYRWSREHIYILEH